MSIEESSETSNNLSVVLYHEQIYSLIPDDFKKAMPNIENPLRKIPGFGIFTNKKDPEEVQKETSLEEQLEESDSLAESSLTQQTTTEINSSVELIDLRFEAGPLDPEREEHQEQEQEQEQEKKQDQEQDQEKEQIPDDIESLQSSQTAQTSRYTISTQQTQSAESTQTLRHLIKEATEEFYELARRKWKIFTFVSTLAVTTSYITGLVLNGKLDTHAISINDRRIFMGMVGLWPTCDDNRDELWRLFSNIFSHSNFSHYAGNIMALFGFSYALELYQHAYTIAPLFIVGVIHGNLAFYYTNPYGFAIGVSHGAFSIVGMNVANIIVNVYAFNRFHSYVIMYLCATIILSEAATYDERNSIAYICHWASGLSGLIGGCAFFKQYKPTRIGHYFSLGMMQLYLFFTLFWFFHYSYSWPPLQSYSNTFEEIETVNCCYEWYYYKHYNPNSTFEDYTCPYKLVYEDYVPYALYKT